MIADIVNIAGKNTFLILVDAGTLLLALLVGRTVYRLAARGMRRFHPFLGADLTNALTNRTKTSGSLLLMIAALSVALHWITLPPTWTENIEQALRPITVGLIGWLIADVVLGIFAGLEARYSWSKTRDNLFARRITTQLRVFRNVALVAVIIITVTAMAMTIPGLKALGISLFASAGVAGLVIGMAARPALSNLIAGVQLALTQPIRIDDVVIVEGEWGRVEEITATYITVLIWDERRLMVPLSYFLEKPVQNWTHTSSELLGTVFFYLDYTAPIEAMRAELKRLVEASPLWDKRVYGIQVTDSKERTLEVRALVSASDASSLWDLRCMVREKMIDFLQRQHPACLPRIRAEMDEPSPPRTASAPIPPRNA